MTSKINIHIEADTADEARRELAALIGPGSLPSTWSTGAAEAKVYKGEEAQKEDFTPRVIPVEPAQAERGAESPTDVPEPARDNRPVGSAPDGKARRTKAEIEADTVFTELAAKTGVSIEKLNEVIGKVGRAEAEKGLNARLENTQASDQPQIRTGESRVGPQDEPEAAEQDAADEAAEVEGNRDPEKPLTADDLKNAMGEYVAKHQLAATQEDGPAIFRDALGTPPDGEQFWKVTLVASAGQKTLQKAIAAWKAAAAAGTRYAAKEA